MGIKWKRVVIAGILSEIVLFVQIPLSPPQIIAWIISYSAMFLGGFFAARTLNSKFILNGALVGVVANILWLGLVTMAYINGKLPAEFSLLGSIYGFVLKILFTTLGGYIAGKMRKSNGEEISR